MRLAKWKRSYSSSGKSKQRFHLYYSFSLIVHLFLSWTCSGRGLAMVGGFVRVGESAEDAAVREALEETGLNIYNLRQFCLFSAPRRDPRRHTAAQVFMARAVGTPKAHDDAKGVRTVPLSELQLSPPAFAFDHGKIVEAFMQHHHPRIEEEGSTELTEQGARVSRNRAGNRSSRNRDAYSWACGRHVP